MQRAVSMHADDDDDLLLLVRSSDSWNGVRVEDTDIRGNGFQWFAWLQRCMGKERNTGVPKEDTKGRMCIIIIRIARKKRIWTPPPLFQ